MKETVAAPQRRLTSTSTLVRVALVLSLAALLLGSIRFARYDWTGIPLDRAPITDQRQVGPDCLEVINPFTTESGRVIKPIVIDEEQYLNLVDYYRGAPRDQLQLTCLYDPFTNRSGMSWIAHWIPVEEGLALGITNVVMLLAGIWFVLLALRDQGADPLALIAAGTLYAVSWNTFFFGTAILVDSGVVAAIALCWYLLVSKRVWFVWPILLVGYPLKETIGIIVPVVWAWCWKEYREGTRSAAAALAPAVVSTAAFVVGVGMWRRLLPQPDAAWEVLPDMADVVHNLTDVISLATFAIGVLPLLIPSLLWYRRSSREVGWFTALLDPAAIGIFVALGVCGWAFITVDLTPRLFWIGYPFAASLTARWFGESPGRDWLARLPFVERLAQPQT